MSADISPTARALRTLEILHARPGASAEELAQRLGVSDRAVRRYIDILREAEIPIESTRGRHGGYRLGRGTRLPPVMFTESEALALVMAVLDGAPRAADDEDPVGGALGKVIRALPPAIARRAGALRAHAAAAPDPKAHWADPTIISTLVAASVSHQRTSVAYRSASGRQWETDVDPWAVIVRFRRWYLLCFSHHVQAVRTYRIDRILQAEPTTSTFTPPPDLEPVTALEENFATGWAYPTRVVFGAPVDEVQPWFNPVMGRLEDHPEGCVLIGTTNDAQMYAGEWLARVPLPFRVEGGAELREAITALAARVGAAAGTSPAPGTMD